MKPNKISITLFLLIALFIYAPFETSAQSYQLQSWGYDILGLNISVNNHTPAPPTMPNGVTNLWRQVSSGGGTPVGANYIFNIAIKDDGTLWAWGDNDYGELGDGTTTSSSVPIQISTENNWIEVSAGTAHGLALKSDGTVYAWGTNSSGQLGDGTTTRRLSPVPVSGITNAIHISAGRDFSFALLSDGTIRAWGNNTNGQLGDGTTTNRLISVPVSGILTATQISAGGLHALALLSDGTIRAWGYNSAGQLGDGTTTTRTTPVTVSGISTATQIRASKDYSYHSLALLSDGTLRSWGENTNGQLGDGTTTNSSTPVVVSGISTATQIAAGYNHCIALLSDGTVKAWGYNGAGQLGDGTTTTRTTPITVSGLSNCIKIDAGIHASRALVTPICAPPTNLTTSVNGSNATTTWTAGGTETAWDIYIATNPSDIPNTNSAPSVSNQNSTTYSFHLATGTTYKVYVRAKCTSPSAWVGSSSLSADNVVISASRSSHTLMIKADGTLWAWGYNSFGSLGVGTQTTNDPPVQVGTDNDWAQVSGGYEFSIALKTNGTLWAWGNNFYGTWGNGSSGGVPNSYSFIPIQIGIETDWVKVSTGVNYTVALKANGTLWAWGQNDHGQLGDGTFTNRASPVQIGVATDWVDISHVDGSTFAIKSDGTLWAWGSNGLGKLGNGNTTDSNVPILIPSAIKWTQVSSGQQHTLAIKSDGSLWAWGDNSRGQLGIGTNSPSYIPVQVGTAHNWAKVAVCLEHSAAITTTGSLWTWGYNGYAALGDGTTTSRNQPVLISSNNWSNIAAGADYHIATKTDGSLWAWGRNCCMELGDGTSTQRLSPVPITTPTSPPIYDECSNATKLTIGSNLYRRTGRTIDATPYSIPNAADCLTANYNEIWYKFDAGAFLSVKVEILFGLPKQGKLRYQVYKGQCGSLNYHSNSVLCASTDQSNDFNFYINGLEENQTYYIAIGSFDGDKVPAYSIQLIDNSAAVAVASPASNPSMTYNTCNNADKTIKIAASELNNNLWIPFIVGDDILVSLNAQGNDLGNVSMQYYLNNPANALRTVNNKFYLDRNFKITPQYQPNPNGNKVKVRLYLTNAEITRLLTALGANINTLGISKFPNDPAECITIAISPSNLSNQTTFIAQSGNVAVFNNTGKYIEFETSSFSEIFVSGENLVVLPVELLDFSAYTEGGNIRLNWATANEKDLALFDIERSNDGQVFEKIGEQKAQGANANYTFWDKTNTSNAAYYRLKINNLDNKSTYSKTIAITQKGKTRPLSIFPNPASKSVTIRFETAHNAERSTQYFTLTDIFGKIVFSKEIDAQAGLNTLTLDVSSFSTGTYIARLGTEVTRLIIR